MNAEQAIADLVALPVSERLRVVHAIWDSLPDEAEIETTGEQQAEIQRRLAAHRTAPSTAISHDELMRRIQSHFSCGG